MCNHFWICLIILPAFINRERFGIYYLRFVVSSMALARFDDIPLEYRVALDTSKKQKVIYRRSYLLESLDKIISFKRWLY
jgi:hypothetical protein